MKINDYIITGGENLNDPAHKTLSFPEKAEDIFYTWYSRLGSNSDETVSYFELPIDDTARLFIRAVWEKKPGHRPVPYYIGLVVSKENYMMAHDYFKINQSLCAVSLADIKEAENKGFVPLELTDNHASPHSAIGQEFTQLKDIKRYGEKDFAKNLTQACLAISINTIDDWFTRLFIAINPSRLHSDFHIVISKQALLPVSKSVSHINPESFDNTPKAARKSLHKISDEKRSSAIAMRKVILLLFFLFTFVVTVYHFFECESKLSKLQNKCRILEQQNIKLQEKNSRLNQENMKIRKNVHNLEKENQKLRNYHMKTYFPIFPKKGAE